MNKQNSEECYMIVEPCKHVNNTIYFLPKHVFEKYMDIYEVEGYPHACMFKEEFEGDNPYHWFISDYSLFHSKSCRKYGDCKKKPLIILGIYYWLE